MWHILTHNVAISTYIEMFNACHNFDLDLKRTKLTLGNF